MTLQGFSFEVWGKVQGVYFRKFTQAKATELRVGGWVRNDKVRGTVQGQVICSDDKQCLQMKEWLSKIGSPKSRIDRAEFVALDESVLHDCIVKFGSNEFHILRSTKH